MEKITLKMLDSERDRKTIYKDIAYLIFDEKNEDEMKELSNEFYQRSAIYSDREFSFYAFGFYIVLNSFFVDGEEYTPLNALKSARENKEKEMILSLSRFARYAVRVRNVQNYAIEPETSLETLWLYSIKVIKNVVESHK
jgi:hypothetical protein